MPAIERNIPVNRWVLPIPYELAETIQRLPHGPLEDHLRAVEGYSVRPFPEAYDAVGMVMLLPLFRQRVDITDYRSRRNPLNRKQEKELKELNQGAYDLALSSGNLHFYVQGDILTDKQIEKTVQEDPQTVTDLNLPFTPNCGSNCAWTSQKHGAENARSDAHMKAVKKTPLFYPEYQIQKFATSTAVGILKIGALIDEDGIELVAAREQKVEIIIFDRYRNGSEEIAITTESIPGFEPLVVQ